MTVSDQHLPDQGLKQDIRNHPIGVFDSGIGGLTVAYALSQVLPYERMIYFGDTAHLPYGDKSTAAIQAYSVKICDVLLRQQVKIILIACNSASAAAYDLVCEYVGSRAHVINVIDPVVSYIATQFVGQSVGLIGTKKTVGSQVYERKMEATRSGVQLASVATPLLAPMIEDGFYNNHISKSIIDNYLDHPTLQTIKALILGCTHYPLIMPQIQAYYHDKGHDIAVIDTSTIVAQAVKTLLQDRQMEQLNPTTPTHHFYVSDYTDSFVASTELFFRQSVELEYYKLWE
jgi:glutamate racemase